MQKHPDPDLTSRHQSKTLILALALITLTSCGSGDIMIGSMHCEHMEDPIGIDNAHPRFSWNYSGSRPIREGSTCKVSVGADSLLLGSGNNDAWESGSIPYDSILLTYAGEDLSPSTKYYWMVSLFDPDGKLVCSSATSSFETGKMKQESWKGKWISDGLAKDERSAPYFRKRVRIEKEIRSARIYISAAGLFDLSVNGKKVGDHQMDPMYTTFDKRNLYVTFDLTKFLQEGENVVGVILGNGWYNHQSTAVWFFDRAEWRDRPSFIADIQLNYADGSSEIIPSDPSWVSAKGPIIFNSIYTAEHYDFRKEMPGWNQPQFDDGTWKSAVEVQKPSGLLLAQQLHPIRIVDTLYAKEFANLGDTCYRFSFERNIAGITRLKVKGPRGAEVRIIHAELLDKDGKADQSNINIHYRPTDDSDPFQTDVLYLSGKEDVFQPRFNYKGFQYAELRSSKAIQLSASDLVALEMHSDVPVAGDIHSSNPLINQIHRASCSSYLANLFGYPTDCPQREKNGWTGDAHIAVDLGLYNFDAITIYEKWLNDFKDVQKPNGVLPCIIPTAIWGFDWANGVDWTGAVAIIPWQVYLFSGDPLLIESMYENIRSYVEYIRSISENYLTDWGLGDWIPVKTKSNLELSTSIYYYVVCDILANSAKLLHKEADAATYRELAEHIRDAINNKFLDPQTGIYCSGSQTEQAMPLYWDVVPVDLKAKVAEKLHDRVASEDYHLDVGLLGSKALLGALSENGYAEEAYKVATQTSYPSWGFWMVNGATTLYENWRIDIVRDASLNHIMFGEVEAWFYKTLGGIVPDEAAPGFRHFFLKPQIPSTLDAFEARHESPYGTILSKWEKRDGKIIYECTVPTGSTATLSFSGKKEELKAGIYRYEF